MEENDIYDEIRAERKYQLTRWGTRADDEINHPMDWVGYIAHYSTRWFSGGFRPYPRNVLFDFRTSMIKVAALAVAAAAWSDRILDGKIHRPDILENELDTPSE
jgi:hypothetical protein